MRPVGIATDTSSDLSADLVEQFRIATAPIIFRMGGEEIAMTTTVDRKAFFTRLQDRQLSGTSAVNTHDWLKAYEALAPDCSEIIALTLSQTLSSTYQSSKIAEGLWTDRPVHCVDSGTVFAGLAVLALGAAEKALAGEGSDRILKWLGRARSETATFMISPSMAMLERIGRVAERKAEEPMPAYALVEVRAGRMELVDTAESFTAAADQLLDYAVERYSNLRFGRAIIDHGRVPGLADDLAWRIGVRWPRCQVTRIDDGPMTAVVADGPGGVAFAIGPVP